MQMSDQPAAQPAGSNQQRPGVTIRGRHFTLPWVIGGVALAFALLTCGCCGTMGLAGAFSGGGTTTTTNTGTQQQQQSTAPQATNTPKAPTATPKPLTPDQVAKKVIAAQLTADGNNTNGLSVKWDASTKTLTVEHDADDNLTNDLIKVGIQLDAFSVMKAAYTEWNIHPDVVIFHDNGSTQDKYGNTSKGPWGTAELDAGTAALFNWANLDRSTAWNAYDVAYYINGL